MAVRIEQNNRMPKPFPCYIREHAEEWRDPNTASEEDSRPGCVVMEVKEPIGPSILVALPIGRMDKACLKTVFRVRVVTRSSSSDGELAMEKV